MIKKRLLNLMSGSKKYIFYCVGWQWLGLIFSIITMFVIGNLFSMVWLGFLNGRIMSLSAVSVLLAILGRVFCSKMATEASAMAGCNVKMILRKKLYKKLASFGPSYHEKVSTAEAVQVAVEGVEQLEVYFGKYLPQLFYSILAPITLFVVLSFFSLKASMILLICVPLIPITIMAVQKLAKRLLNKYWGIYTGLGDSFLENLQGLTTLKIYQADEKKAQEMDQEAEHFRKITMKVLMMQLNSIIVMDMVAYGGAAVGMIVCLREFQAGALSLTGAFTIILLSAEFFIPMRLLGSFFHIAMNGIAAADKLFGILDIPEEGQGSKQLEGDQVEIMLDGVDFAYEPDRKILKKVSLVMSCKGRVSLVGRSGCGKSTVAGILSGKNHGYQGHILINGMELSEISEDSLMENITLVSHDSYLFKGTVEDNLRMAARGASKEEFEDVLKEVNLYDFLKTQKGLLTELTERAENLSGGQRQRLALARAILHDTPVYIFDEATSNIDAESEEQIMQVIRRLALDRAVLLISHRLANVVDSERIYVLQDGAVMESGTHKELLHQKGSYAELYTRQMELEKYAQTKQADNAEPKTVINRNHDKECKSIQEKRGGKKYA